MRKGEITYLFWVVDIDSRPDNDKEIEVEKNQKKKQTQISLIFCYYDIMNNNGYFRLQNNSGKFTIRSAFGQKWKHPIVQLPRS